MQLLVWDFSKDIIRFEEHNTTSLYTRGAELRGISGSNETRLYSGEATVEGHFKTGWLGAGGLIAEKAHDKGLICYQGTINLKIYVDKERVFCHTFISEGIVVEQFKLPLSSVRNYFVEVELCGTGEMFELILPQESARQ